MFDNLTRKLCTYNEIFILLTTSDFLAGKKLSDGKSISGKGRLITARVDTIQKLHGLALRKNKGNVKKMKEGVMTILDHYSENPTHENCPKGSDSWCSFNRDKITGQFTHKPMKTLLAPGIVDTIKPLFERLKGLGMRFLSICKSTKTKSKEIVPLPCSVTCPKRTAYFFIRYYNRKIPI